MSDSSDIRSGRYRRAGLRRPLSRDDENALLSDEDRADDDEIFHVEFFRARSKMVSKSIGGDAKRHTCHTLRLGESDVVRRNVESCSEYCARRGLELADGAGSQPRS